MADKKPSHIVKHRRLFMTVKGKLEHVPQGTQIELTTKQAKSLGGKVGLISSESVDISDTDTNVAAVTKANEELAKVQATNAELAKENEALKASIAEASKTAK